MTEFLIKRIATIIPTLIFVSMLIFGLQQLLPGDPAKILAGEEQDPSVIAHLREKLHLDEPLPLRYAYWVGGALKGDLGESVRNQQPVLELVLQKLPVTVQLATMAMFIALVIGIPSGIVSAVGPAVPPRELGMGADEMLPRPGAADENDCAGRLVGGFARDAQAADIKRVHLRMDQEAQCVFGRFHDGFTGAIERGVHHDGHAGQRKKPFQHAAEFAGGFIHRLYPRRAIGMGDGGHL